MAGAEHRGAYTCGASNAAGSATTTMEGTLYVVAASLGNVEMVDLGTDVTFNCITTGEPPSGLTFEWLSPTSDDPNMQITGRLTSTLSISDVGVGADGMYECRVGFQGTQLTTASGSLCTIVPNVSIHVGPGVGADGTYECRVGFHGAQLLTANGTLHTIVPDVSISNIMADEGGMLVLVCNATNTPNAPSNLNFSWYFDNHLVEDGSLAGRASIVSTLEDSQHSAMSTFTLNNVMRMTSSVEGDGGTYRCEVTNRLSRDAQPASTNITVRFVPIISTFPMGTFIQNVSAMPTLTCVAFSTPPVFNVTIFRDGTQLDTAADNSVMYPFPAPLNLITDNGALFECVVFNEAGVRSSRCFMLIVQAPPGDVDNNTITRELVSLTRANLLWTAPPDNNAAITYTISLCLLQAKLLSSVCTVDSAQSFNTTEATIEIPNLVPNRWYEVIIVASNMAGSSDPSGRFILKTATSDEAKPANVKIILLTDSRIVLTWGLPSIADPTSSSTVASDVTVSEFNLTFNRHNELPSSPFSIPYNARQKLLGGQVMSLTPAIAYQIQISVLYSSPSLISSEVVANFVTLGAVYVPTQMPTATNVGSRSLTVNWTAPEGAAFIQRYIVSYEVAGMRVKRQSPLLVPAGTTSAILTDLTPATDLEVGVDGEYNINGDIFMELVAAHATLTTAEDKPSAPLNLQSNGVSTFNSIPLQLSPPDMPNGVILDYEVRYSLVSSPSAEMTVTAISTSLTLTSLTPLTQYRIDVRARNSVDFSDYSSVVTIETSFEVLTPSNNTTLIIGVIVATAILVLAMAAVVIVWLVLRHRRSMVSRQKGNMGEGLASELAESNDPKPIAFRSCAAYGVVHQPVEDEKNHEYEAIPLMPLAHLQPARGSGPTSSPQTSGPYENTRALQDHRAVISGQARSTAPPSHSLPQELGGDEHLYEPTGGPASTATPTTATPGDKDL